MKTADMHCDTIGALLWKRREGMEAGLLNNDLHMDLRRMKKAEYLLQNFALFVDQNETEDPYLECKEEYRIFCEEMERNQESIAWGRTYKEIEKCQKEGKMAALLTIEEGEVCQGDLRRLREFYDLGVRMMTLTWNYDNSLSTSALGHMPPCGRSYEGKRPGLTETGISFVEVMEELGMIPDVSHMSDAGIKDMLEIAKKPFVASHSNARALCAHPRNLTDDQLKRMGEKGCVIGANFYSRFLKKGADFTKTEWIADHILYMTDKAGVESVGFGTDFDGIDCELEMESCAGIQSLAEVLKRRGMSETQLEKVFYKNVLRIYQELL